MEVQCLPIRCSKTNFFSRVSLFLLCMPCGPLGLLHWNAVNFLVFRMQVRFLKWVSAVVMPDFP